jgi:uncharacterized protein
MIEKSDIFSIELPTGGNVSVLRWRFKSPSIQDTQENQSIKRMSIVAGIRGDAPEGIRVAYRLLHTLKELEHDINGVVDLYPCVNPLAVEQGQRYWPFFDIDLNRIFPGKKSGHPPHQLAYRLTRDISQKVHKNIDEEHIVLELRGARPSFQILPQALVRNGDAYAQRLAKHANVKMLWKRTPGPAATSTFAYQFPHAIVLEGGCGNRLISEVGQTLHDGVLNIMSHIGILPEDKLPFPWMSIETPITTTDEDLLRVRVESSGLFLPKVTIGEPISENDVIGTVIEPSSGAIIEKVFSPSTGIVFALREQPVVSIGIMVARVLRK